ncbi:tRNA uridine-5-carboxymethylaminomethyl(34) synthesis enzyme MnmG [Candidatus Vidania fulgoroideorum]
MIKYDIIVVGGGHAGIEACNSGSKLKKNILLITNKIEEIGKISCNPSIGGVGKGQLVREIEIFGGIMPKAADYACTFFKTLNASRGFAVRSTRMQIDKYKYSLLTRYFLKKIKNLKILQDNVNNILIKKNKIIGIITKSGLKILCECLILTTGTFLGSKTFCGNITKKECRDNEDYNTDLYKRIKDIIPGISKFKTGTPPRIDKNTVDYSKVKLQKNEKKINYFSLFNIPLKNNLLNCWQTCTSKDTKDIISKNISKSSMYNGILKSPGPRYCPSIEDKIFRFPNNPIHNIFLELESSCTNEMYLNGLSNSFDNETQYKIVKSISGLKNAFIMKFGYSIEYYFFNPIYLKRTLESSLIKNLFLAGQINGTTGYEEAASQGLIAGVNASRLIDNKKPLILKKKKSYIGILIKDITTNKLTEPYRMFTSRSENRILMREDNVIERLLNKSKKFKLISNKKYFKLIKFYNISINVIKKSKKIYLKKSSIFEVVKNTKINIEYFIDSNKFNIYLFKKKKINNIFFLNYINAEIKYSYYKKKSIKENKLFKNINFKIPLDFDFSKIKGLTSEFLEKVKKNKIKDFYCLKYIECITPTALYAIKNYFLKNYFKNKNMI